MKQKQWTLTIRRILLFLKENILTARKGVIWFVGVVNFVMRSGLAWIKLWWEKIPMGIQSLERDK